MSKRRLRRNDVYRDLGRKISECREFFDPEGEVIKGLEYEERLARERSMLYRIRKKKHWDDEQEEADV